VARPELHGSELIIDMKHLSGFNQEGENVLLELRQQGVSAAMACLRNTY
jgi:hypothetical protein